MEKELDYIIVGFGLAGLHFAEQLYKNNKTFVVISKLNESSSKVAGGMYNPVILKRFTLAWQATQQIQKAIPIYQKLEQKLNRSFLKPLPLYRVLNSVEEQNNWFVAADKPLLTPFLDTKLIPNNNQHIQANFKYGCVTESGRVCVDILIEAYKQNLETNNQFINDFFDHKLLQQNNNIITYKKLKAKQIVFCEGFGMQQNPLFNYLALKPSKGETITIEATALKVNTIIKSGVFIIPLHNKNQYLVGATYNWTDESWKTTEDAKLDLIQKLEKIIKCKYTIIDQKAGIRPTVKDRRPLLGRHPEHQNTYVLNGLGTRGVMVAPTVSEQLYNYIENNQELPHEIDIKRYQNEYQQ